MVRKILYAVSVPEDAQQTADHQHRNTVSKDGVVSGNRPITEHLSSDPSQVRFEGMFRAKYAEVMARETEELFNNDAIREVAYYGYDFDGNRVRTEDDGYYTLETLDMNTSDPRDDTQSSFNWKANAVKKGTRKTSWRAIKTDVTDIASEQTFGNVQEPYVYIPSSASTVRWFNERDGTVEAASSTVSGRSAEFITVDGYNTDDASFDDPTLIFDVPYTVDGKTDPKVWDTYGRTKSGPDDDGVTNTWGRVFAPEHEFSGNMVIENGILRITIDESGQALSASRWDDASGSYSSVALPDSDWLPIDLDLVRSGDDRVKGQIIFENSADGSLFHLNLNLQRGYEDAFFLIPPNESGPVPASLGDRLDPIAAESILDPSPERTLIDREEVRR